MEQEIENEETRKNFLNERQKSTLRTMFDQLLLHDSEIPLAVAAWRARLTDNLVKVNLTKPACVKEDWELRRKEVKIFAEERANERCCLQIGNIWRAPWTYQSTAAQNELIPLRNHTNQVPTAEDTKMLPLMPAPLPPQSLLSPKKDANKPKSAGIRKISLKSAKIQAELAQTPQPQLLEVIAATEVKKAAKTSKEEKVVSKIVSDFRECLEEIAEEDRNAVMVDCDSGDEWETDEEKVLDAWLYDPAGPEAIERLPADFKFVSYMDRAKPTGPVSAADAAKVQEKPKPKAARVRREPTDLEEASSSSDEGLNWALPSRK